MKLRSIYEILTPDLVHSKEDILRKVILSVSLFLIWILGTQLLFGYTEGNIWEQFVNNPDDKNYELCRRIISNSLTGPYGKNKYGEKINTPTHQYLINRWDLYAKFLQLVRDINPYAVELALQLYPLTDGGASEDLSGQISMIVKEKPDFFLSMLNKYKIKNRHTIDNFVSSYPIDEFVDNIEGRIKETKERIKALQKVKNKEVIELRGQCIDILSQYLIRLEKVQKETDD